MKPRTYKFNDLLEVTWLDITDNNTWLTPYTAMRTSACLCKSLGYFLNRDEEVLRISATIQVEDGDRGVITIPWGCIKSIKKR